MIHIKKINEIINGELFGADDYYIKGPCSIINGKENFITYIKHNKYIKYINTTSASAIIVDKSIDIPEDNKKTILKVDNPSIAFLSFLKYFENTLNVESKCMISNSSKISKTVKMGSDVFIGENVVVSDNVQILNNVRIESNSIIEENVTIGDNTIIKSNGIWWFL